VGQEYFINSQELQNKVANLLPSQGGAGAGFDLSASTQIVPIIDLTESAEGSNFRQDLQTALSFKSSTAFNVRNASTTVISNTGYYRIVGVSTIIGATAKLNLNNIQLTDGATTKIVWEHTMLDLTDTEVTAIAFDLNVFVEAGESVIVASDSTRGVISGSTRQIADINGELTNP
jgi:hypothetical protein